MSVPATPSKTADINTTYIECSWSFHKSGGLFVRLSPALASSLHLKKSVHIKFLGSVTNASYSSKLKTSVALHKDVFKLLVNTQSVDESQDVDLQPAEWYALKEDRFSDFSNDATAKKMTNPTWTTHSGLLTAFKDAIRSKKLGKKGEWLKKLVKTELQETQLPEEVELFPEQAGDKSDVPESFGYTRSDKNPGVQEAPEKKAGKEPVSDEDEKQAPEVTYVDDEDDDEEEMGIASQQAFQGSR